MVHLTPPSPPDSPDPATRPLLTTPPASPDPSRPFLAPPGPPWPPRLLQTPPGLSGPACLWCAHWCARGAVPASKSARAVWGRLHLAFVCFLLSLSPMSKRLGPRRLSRLTRPVLLGRRPVCYSREMQKAENWENGREARVAPGPRAADGSSLSFAEKRELPDSGSWGACPWSARTPHELSEVETSSRPLDEGSGGRGQSQAYEVRQLCADRTPRVRPGLSCDQAA